MRIIVLGLIGLTSGIISGFFGIGGGVVIIPALVGFLNFSQQQAVGTTLAVLLPPIGLAAAAEYYRRGAVDIQAALIIAISFMVASWFGARWALKLSNATLKLYFGVFLAILGIRTCLSAWRAREASTYEMPQGGNTSKVERD